MYLQLAAVGSSCRPHGEFALHGPTLWPILIAAEAPATDAHQQSAKANYSHVEACVLGQCMQSTLHCHLEGPPNQKRTSRRAIAPASMEGLRKALLTKGARQGARSHGQEP